VNLAVAESNRESSNKSYHEAQSRMRLLPSYYRWIISKFYGAISGRVIELGVGAGYQIEHYKDLVDQIIAVDYNPELLKWLKQSFPEEKVQPLKVDLLGDWSEVEAGRADTVLALDVVEHFEDDALFISKARDLLKPGGNLCIKVPANSKLFSSIDEASGHFRRYDPEPLRKLMQDQGLAVIKQEYINPIGALLYRYKKEKKSNFSKTFPPFVLKTANLIIPVLRPLDNFQALGGLSLVGTYQKK